MASCENQHDCKIMRIDRPRSRVLQIPMSVGAQSGAGCKDCDRLKQGLSRKIVEKKYMAVEQLRLGEEIKPLGCERFGVLENLMQLQDNRFEYANNSEGHPMIAG